MTLHQPVSAFVGRNVQPSLRARFTERRTYLRPKNEDGTIFETPDEALDRVIGHQRYLWEGALKRPLGYKEELELAELRRLITDRKVSMSGRVKWMGGTDIVKERPSAAFNCSFTIVETPADVVDVFWLLLQGCGVGFKPKVGLLTGLPSTIQEVEFIQSVRKEKGGAEDTMEFVDGDSWTISFGDSAKGWAKGVGMLLAGKARVRKLIIDLSELRPGGKRLKGYGWLSSGWEPLRDGIAIIIRTLQAKSERILDAIDILDIVNALGTVLSSRRSAQIALLEEIHPDADRFIAAKEDFWQKGLMHRAQSNNSIMFDSKPTSGQLTKLLSDILKNGEPGFVNRAAARKRAPEMEGLNPCAEILLPSKGFCNLVQVVAHRFNGDFEGLERALYLAGRANYRQTCVSMRDGVLQLQWNDNQKLLRLCGVSFTGYVSWEHMNSPEHLRKTRDAARKGADSMADELGGQRARRVTQIQPAGTVSKVMGLDGDEVHEGAHLALSRWIFNNINFSIHDPMIERLRAANYHTFPNPFDPTGVLVRFPVEYPASPLFTKVKREIEGVVDELEINTESAVSQLERYRILMENYVEHNCSITVSFDETEIPAMVAWFIENWDTYVGVSFLRRNDPSLTAQDLGFAYLPQEAVSERVYQRYVSQLLPVQTEDDRSEDMLDVGDCSTGACPIR